MSDATNRNGVSTGRLAFAIVGEVALDNGDRAVGPVARQNATLVVDESAMLDAKIPALGANSSSVSVSSSRTRKGQMANRNVVARDNEERLALADLVGDDDSFASALDRQLIGAPHGAVEIFAGRDGDGVARRGDRGRRTRHRQDFIWADGEQLCRRRRNGAGEDQKQDRRQKKTVHDVSRRVIRISGQRRRRTAESPYL